MNSRFSALIVALAATAASGEAYKVNVHLSPVFGLQFSPSGMISGADGKVDFNVLGLDFLAPQIEIFGFGSGNNNLLVEGSLFGAGIGVRARLLNDEKGYWKMPGGTNGNLHGNLWIDAHVALANGGPRVGFDVGLGYEVSLIDGLQIGPFAKFIFLKDSLLVFGLSFSIGAGATVPPVADPDGDGIMGDADKCPTEAENKDGKEDEDGCPEKAAPAAPAAPPPAAPESTTPAPSSTPAPSPTP